MQVQVASEPAPGRLVNEDAALHVGSLVGVFDGVTAPKDVENGCIHGPAWYVQRLTARLTEIIKEQPGRPLPDILAEAIERVRGDHQDRCDLDNPATPAATACLARPNKEHLDYLVLSDCTFIADHGDTLTVVTDHRLAAVVAELRQALALDGTNLPIGTPLTGKYEFTNQPHGYWVAAANPQAAHHAVTGTLDLSGPGRVRRAALLTDGASRMVDDYALMDWRQLLDVLTTDGPHELIQRVRLVEDAGPQTGRLRYKRHDDATAALCTFEENQ